MTDDQKHDTDDVREIIASTLDIAEERAMSLKEFQRIFKTVGRNLSGRKFSDLQQKLSAIYDLEKLEKLQEKYQILLIDISYLMTNLLLFIKM